MLGGDLSVAGAVRLVEPVGTWMRIVEPGDDAVDFAALFAGLPTPFLVMTPDLVIVEANPAYLALLDRTREQIIGRPVFEAFPPTPRSLAPDGTNAVKISFERARDTGRVDPMPIQKYDIEDPVTGEIAERQWSLISAPVLDDEGRTILVVQRTEDVTDYVRDRFGRAERAQGDAWQQRVEAVEADLWARMGELRDAQQARDLAARRLAALGEVALALTAAETVEDLERIVVDQGLSVVGADGGAVLSLHGEGGWRITVNDALGEHVQVLSGRVPYDSPTPAAWTARTGQRLLLPTRAAGLAFDPCMAEIYEDTKREGWAFLPLTVQGECVGSLSVAWTHEHPFRPDELTLLDSFAAQCAQALQRLRASAAERAAALARLRISETLQRSLLTSPPAPDGLQIAVRYQPASSEAQVGGDWYDAFVTAAGSTLLVVGDVNGHDGVAAAMMGQVRNLVRGLAYDSQDGPAQLLSRLDASLQGLRLETLATAVLARVEIVEGRRYLRWSNAGHLPPLLRHPDGSVQVLGGEHDLLLGLDPATTRGERVVELPDGACLLLFTDGLVERRGESLDEGIALLRDVLASEGGSAPEVLCDRLLEAVVPGGNEDDIAMLVLQVD